MLICIHGAYLSEQALGYTTNRIYWMLSEHILMLGSHSDVILLTPDDIIVAKVNAHIHPEVAKR